MTLAINGTYHQHIIPTNNEFPKICDHLVGLRNHSLFHLSASQHTLWYDTVCQLDISSEKEDSYHFGADFLAEEHINICPERNEKTGYLLGTALHVPSKRTCLNLFEANNLSASPIARAWLPYFLPLGFHGHFMAA
ncbi:carotenoid oxygenase family protein [Shewanella surugensis]|uniref:Carotenoid oxygenase family protein n=1 Tax=Shewanella surugensis TaxID=212020 RepID=A0ABT0LD54_9GAMM|nr:carotenoid oxygenase family protein [Shewanella surugensis]MCL1125609.1 carotenoid oxygenase family protein [Shewanella surugensis]